MGGEYMLTRIEFGAPFKVDKLANIAVYIKENVNIASMPLFVSVVYGRWAYVAKFYKARSLIDVQKFIRAFYSDLVVVQYNTTLYVHLPADLAGDMLHKVILFC